MRHKRKRRKPQRYVPVVSLDVDRDWRLWFQLAKVYPYVHARVVLEPSQTIVWHGWYKGALIAAATSDYLRSEAMGILRKVHGKALEAANNGGKPDAGSKKKYPGIVELLTATTDDDGKERETSSLSIRWASDGVKVGLHEPNLRLSLWATAATLDTALEALEGRLQSEDADWRPWSQQQIKGGKKRAN